MSTAVGARPTRSITALALSALVFTAATVLGASAGAGPGATITGTAVIATAGVPFTGTVASSSGIIGEVSIDFGDATTFSVTPEVDGSIVVTHTWAEGSYDVTISQGPVSAHTIVDVFNPSSAAFFTDTDIVPVPPGGTDTATVPGVSATLANPSTSGAVLVGVYSGNPTPSALPLAVMYVDVFAYGGGAGTTVVVTLQLPPGSPPAGQVTLSFFDVAANRWQPIQAPFTVDAAQNRITFTLSSSTSPSLDQLSGTVFAASSPVVSASPSFTG